MGRHRPGRARRVRHGLVLAGVWTQLPTGERGSGLSHSIGLPARPRAQSRSALLRTHIAQTVRCRALRPRLQPQHTHPPDSLLAASDEIAAPPGRPVVRCLSRVWRRKHAWRIGRRATGLPRAAVIPAEPTLLFWSVVGRSLVGLASGDPRPPRPSRNPPPTVVGQTSQPVRGTRTLLVSTTPREARWRRRHGSARTCAPPNSRTRSGWSEAAMRCANPSPAFVAAVSPAQPPGTFRAHGCHHHDLHPCPESRQVACAQPGRRLVRTRTRCGINGTASDAGRTRRR